MVAGTYPQEKIKRMENNLACNHSNLQNQVCDYQNKFNFEEVPYFVIKYFDVTLLHDLFFVNKSLAYQKIYWRYENREASPSLLHK